MKHLRKYNEIKDEMVINEYINDCFIEFIDYGAKVKHRRYADIETSFSKELENSSYFDITINVPDCWFSSGSTLSKNKKSAETLVEFYTDIENCLDKVKIKYPNIKEVYITNSNGHERSVQIILIQSL